MRLSNVITSAIPVIDSCPVFTRMKAYVTQLGRQPIIEHVVRDGVGRPLDLSRYFRIGKKPKGQLILRSREAISPLGPRNQLIEIPGKCVNPEEGVLRFKVPPLMTSRAGIYQLSITVADRHGMPLKTDNPIFWVERSLFGLDHQFDYTIDGQRQHKRRRTRRRGSNSYNRMNRVYENGPPTVEELRMAIMDNMAGDNLLLDSVEFSDEQIAVCLTRPIAVWEAEPPPLSIHFDTRDFPFREYWLKATIGYLFSIAANNYRRNHLPYSAGGISIDDKNKEQPYLAASRMLLEEYNQFVQRKKYEINLAEFQGSLHSVYSNRFI